MEGRQFKKSKKYVTKDINRSASSHELPNNQNLDHLSLTYVQDPTQNKLQSEPLY